MKTMQMKSVLWVSFCLAFATLSFYASNASATLPYHCNPYAYTQCLGNTVYWFDSCGNQQELYQYCQGNQTCSNGQCVGQVNYCTPYFVSQCSGDSIYWYNSCGARQEFVKYCPYGCQDNQCKEPQNVYVKNYKKACYNNNVYWYDSKNAVQEVFKSCDDSNQCTQDSCKDAKCINTLKCDGSTCEKGSDAYCTGCSHIGDGVCNCGETKETAPVDCGNSNAPTTQNNISAALLCQKPGPDAQWQETLDILAGEEIYCMTTVKNLAESSQTSNVILTAVFPSQISYTGNMQVNGNAVNDGNITSGYNLGALTAGMTQTITFTGKAQEKFTEGVQKISVTAVSGDKAVTSDLTVNFKLDNQSAGIASIFDSGIFQFFRRWFSWILVGIILLFLFVIVFRRVSSER